MADAPRLLRITGPRSRRIAAVLERADHDEASRPLVVIAPAFEHSIRHGVVIARYLLREGFDVLRYDASNHVGLSDGEIADFSLTSALADLVEVVRFAREGLAPANISVVANSLAGRVAIRAAGQLAGELTCVAAIACVVNVRATVTAACGSDTIGDWLSGRVSDVLATFKVATHPVKYTFSKIANDDDWLTPESALADMDAARSVPFFNVHGDLDPWVSTEEILAFAARAPNAELVVLRGAVHQLNPVTARTALRHLVCYLVKRGKGRALDPAAVRDLDWNDLVGLNKRERAWERTPIEAWEPRRVGELL